MVKENLLKKNCIKVSDNFVVNQKKKDFAVEKTLLSGHSANIFVRLREVYNEGMKQKALKTIRSKMRSKFSDNKTRKVL